MSKYDISLCVTKLCYAATIQKKFHHEIALPVKDTHEIDTKLNSWRFSRAYKKNYGC